MKLGIKSLLLISLTAVAPVFATPILVPNGDFTNSLNDGAVGGGLVNVSGTSAIGTGPWFGTYNALLGLLAPPSEQIVDSSSGGFATISSVASIHTINGYLDTSGWFQQSLTSTYSANTIYTLTATVNAGSVLTAGVLANAGIGIGLLNGTTALADSTNLSQLLSISLLSGSNYQVVLQYITGSVAPTGNIGIQLFDRPTGLTQTSLLSTVSFSHVTLDQQAVVTPEITPVTQISLGGAMILIARANKKRRSRRFALRSL